MPRPPRGSSTAEAEAEAFATPCAVSIIFLCSRGADRRPFHRDGRDRPRARRGGTASAPPRSRAASSCVPRPRCSVSCTTRVSSRCSHSATPAPGPTELLTRWVGATTLADHAPQRPTEVAGLMAAVASTVAELHRGGIAHRQLRADHVLVDGARPVLCGVSHLGAGTAADLATDVADLGRLLTALLTRCRRGIEPAAQLRLRRLTQLATTTLATLDAARLATELSQVRGARLPTAPAPDPEPADRQRPVCTGDTPGTSGAPGGCGRSPRPRCAADQRRLGPPSARAEPPRGSRSHGGCGEPGSDRLRPSQRATVRRDRPADRPRR